MNDRTPLPMPILRELTRDYGPGFRTGYPASRHTVTVPADTSALRSQLRDAERDLLACQTELDAERDAHRIAMSERDAAVALYRDEFADRNRIAGLHAELSAENAVLRERLAWMARYVASIGADRIRRHRANNDVPGDGQ